MYTEVKEEARIDASEVSHPFLRPPTTDHQREDESTQRPLSSSLTPSCTIHHGRKYKFL
jgi:hypothetical protein